MEALNIKIDKAVADFVHKVEQNTDYAPMSEVVTYDALLKNKMLIVQSIRRGIPYDFFNLIKECSPFNEEDWASFLGISTKSMQRNKVKPNFVFKAIQSEKIFELAEVTVLGKSVFDSEKQFYLWLNTPCFSLNSLTPIELLKDSYGKEMVVSELHKIDQGIFV
jgi:putative toxin-antitoxin system antitoxin component (TIGR02293 family)